MQYPGSFVLQALPDLSGPPNTASGCFRHTCSSTGTMSTFHDASSSSQPFKDPTPLPSSVPKVDELGATSGPLKSAAFFIGAYCKDYNGA